MRYTLHIAIAIAIAAVALTVGCGPTQPTPIDAAAEAPNSGSATAAPQGAATNHSKVLETMNSGGYTYIHFEKDGQKSWAAAPETKVAVGDAVTVPPGALMTNYTSKTLNRTFEQIYFVSKISVVGAPEPASAPASAPSNVALGGENRATVPNAMISGITKVEGGKTVAEVFAEKTALSGKTVKIRAKVVKYNADILGKNWLHIQDGTGAAQSNDLTVTTLESARVGDTVVIEGVIALDRDLGGGYKYDIVIEEAKITVE